MSLRSPRRRKDHRWSLHIASWAVLTFELACVRRCTSHGVSNVVQWVHILTNMRPGEKNTSCKNVRTFSSKVWHASSKQCFVMVSYARFLFAILQRFLLGRWTCCWLCFALGRLPLKSQRVPSLSSPRRTGVAQQQEDLDLDKEFGEALIGDYFSGVPRVAYMHMSHVCMHSSYQWELLRCLACIS